MSSFFEDTMTGLLQAVSIERGNIPVAEVSGMPAPTFRTCEVTPMPSGEILLKRQSEKAELAN